MGVFEAFKMLRLVLCSCFQSCETVCGDADHVMMEIMHGDHVRSMMEIMRRTNPLSGTGSIHICGS